MRATDLLGCAVTDSAGERIGSVHDLRFELTWSAEGVPRCRLTGFECLRSDAVGHRFGYGAGNMAGPWPLGRIFARRRRLTLEIDWDDVARFERPKVELRRSREQLERR